jgi:hypothetical protein
MVCSKNLDTSKQSITAKYPNQVLSSSPNMHREFPGKFNDGLILTHEKKKGKI